MNHCLVFGARGHLAKTRIIPALEKRGCPYTSVSRGMSPRLVTEHTKDIPDLVAFMSIPTHNFEENVTPYMNEIDPLYILEKPHGHSLEDFEKLKKFIDDNNLKVVYNDHYLGKTALEEIETFDFPSNMKTIKIVLRESANINERITYFDSVGILGDMYQSHCVFVFAAILTRITGKPRKEILKDLSVTKPRVLELNKSPLYLGMSPTRALITMKYEDIKLVAELEKLTFDNKSICIDGVKRFDLNKGICPYERVFDQIEKGDTNFFLDEDEVRYLWDHTSLIAC